MKNKNNKQNLAAIRKAVRLERASYEQLMDANNFIVDLVWAFKEAGNTACASRWNSVLKDVSRCLDKARLILDGDEE